MDPENEVKASTEAVNNNLSTLAEEAAAQGQDWEENLEQRARELKKIKDLEVKYDVDMTPDAGKVPQVTQNDKKPKEQNVRQEDQSVSN